MVLSRCSIGCKRLSPFAATRVESPAKLRTSILSTVQNGCSLDTDDVSPSFVARRGSRVPTKKRKNESRIFIKGTFEVKREWARRSYPIAIESLLKQVPVRFASSVENIEHKESEMRKTEDKSKIQAVFLPKVQDFLAKAPSFSRARVQLFLKKCLHPSPSLVSG